MLKLVPCKLKREDVRGFDTTTLMTAFYGYIRCNTSYKNQKKIQNAYNDYLIRDLTEQASKRLIRSLGKPAVTMDLEASPGVWLLDHSTGIRLVVFSDCHRKNPWKGTSFEIDLAYTANGKPTDVPLEFFLEFFEDVLNGNIEL